MYLSNSKKTFISENVWLLVLIATFIISFFAYLGSHFSRERVVLYFPDSVSNDLVGEYRVLPRERGRADRMAQLVEEAILGPANIRSYNVFQRDTSLRSVFLMNRRSLVVDLDRQALARIPDRDLTVADSLGILRKIIRANFPGLRNIYILVDGQEPFIPTYSGEAGADRENFGAAEP